MKNSLGILLGLTAALCWGLSDFVARFATRRTGAYRALLAMQFVGFTALGVYLAATGTFSTISAIPRHAWVLGILAGVLNMIGAMALYHSFEIGVLTVVAPISSSYPVITVALALLSGERLHARSATGLALALLGLILAATSFSATHATPRARISRGAGWSILSMVCFGVMFWFLGFRVLPVLGAALSVWVIRITTAALLLAARPFRQAPLLPRGSVWWLLAIMGLLDTTAYVANNAGLHAGPVAIVTVVASLFGAVTVLLSSLFLRERLDPSQWLGIALIFAGIILVSL